MKAAEFIIHHSAFYCLILYTEFWNKGHDILFQRTTKIKSSKLQLVETINVLKHFLDNNNTDKYKTHYLHLVYLFCFLW